MFAANESDKWKVLNSLDLDLILHLQDNVNSNRSRYEKQFEKKLKEWGVKYETQYAIYNRGRIYFLDFFIPKYKVYVEIDGGYHNTVRQKEKDEYRRLVVESLGFREVRIKNEAVGIISKERFFEMILPKKKKKKRNIGNQSKIRSKKKKDKFYKTMMSAYKRVPRKQRSLTLKRYINELNGEYE